MGGGGDLGAGRWVCFHKKTGFGAAGGEGFDEDAVALAGFAVEGADEAGEGGEEGAVGAHVFAAVGGGQVAFAEADGEGGGVEAPGPEEGAEDGDVAEFRVFELVHDFGGEAGGFGEEWIGELEVLGVEAVLAGVAGGAGLAFGRTGAGGLAGVGAVGGEAAFGDGHG